MLMVCVVASCNKIKCALLVEILNLATTSDCGCGLGFLFQTMGSVNAQMNPAQMQNTLKNFEMESAKMDLKEDMSK